MNLNFKKKNISKTKLKKKMCDAVIFFGPSGSSSSNRISSPSSTSTATHGVSGPKCFGVRRELDYTMSALSLHPLVFSLMTRALFLNWTTAHPLNYDSSPQHVLSKCFVRHCDLMVLRSHGDRSQRTHDVTLQYIQKAWRKSKTTTRLYSLFLVTKPLSHTKSLPTRPSLLLNQKVTLLFLF